MNSQVHKRSARSSTTAVPAGSASMNQNNNNTKTNNGLDASKRRRKLRRKAKENKTQKRMVLLQAIMCAAFLVALVLFVIKALKSNERGIKLPPNMLKKRQMAKQMRPDLDNPPMADVKGNGPFKNLRNRFWSISQYRHSDYMRDLGDRSPAYANLRKEYDALLPSGDEESLERMKLAVQSLRKRKYENLMAHDMPYDVHNCPDDPPPNYPYAWNIKDVLDNWGTDDMIPKEAIYQGICVFDYETEKEKALKYGELELPFVVRDDPKVLRTVERWSQQGYMQKLLGKHTRYRTEYSPNNHFMYWNKPKRKAVENHIIEKDWKPPTEMSRMSFSNWLEHANVTDDKLGSDNEHWYFRLIGCGEMGKSCDKDSSEYLFDELSFFQPTEDNPLYMVDPKKQKGIHCRFGMKGVTAVNHFDGSRNSIALLGGERRYFLSHPDQCENLNLFPRGHPSARHSAVDWSNPDWEKFPSFADAEVNEVVLQAGDVLYLPTDWFHHIISLELNFQCNTRSGTTDHYLGAIKQCGF